MEALYPGCLRCQGTPSSAIKGLGRIYLQSIVDAHCSLGFGKAYRSGPDYRRRCPFDAVASWRKGSSSNWPVFGCSKWTCRPSHCTATWPLTQPGSALQ
jgi:hypothetical protein